MLLAIAKIYLQLSSFSLNGSWALSAVFFISLNDCFFVYLQYVHCLSWKVFLWVCTFLVNRREQKMLLDRIHTIRNIRDNADCSFYKDCLWDQTSLFEFHANQLVTFLSFWLLSFSDTLSCYRFYSSLEFNEKFYKVKGIRGILKNCQHFSLSETYSLLIREN